MKILGVLFGFIVLAAVFVLWYRVYKSIKGEGSAAFPSGRDKSHTANSLEEFIASYKRGEVVVPRTSGTPTQASPVAGAASRAPLRPLAPAAAAGAAAQSASVPSPRAAFVSGTTKLAYLACRAGLRDHHVFVHVQLTALGAADASAPALASGGLDLLICDAGLSPVAAVDLIDAAGAPADASKSDYLKSLGIRYLRLSAKSLPRPADWHALLYKM